MAKKYEIVSVPKNEIVVYQPNATMRLEVRLEDNTVWLSQQQLCQDVQLAFTRYQQQYPNNGLTLTQWPKAHDRFIVCDNTVWILKCAEESEAFGGKVAQRRRRRPQGPALLHQRRRPPHVRPRQDRPQARTHPGAFAEQRKHLKRGVK